MHVEDSACDDGGDRCAAAAVIGMGFGAGAQSGAPRTTTPSREWPTYGHDPGGMRFSPLTQITPANVEPAQGGVGLSHEARGRADAGWPRRRSRCRRPGTRARRPWTRRLGLQLERGHAARHQRHDVSRDAVLPRRGRRRDHRQGDRGRFGCRPEIRRREASSTGPATRRRRRRSSSARATASCTRSTPRPGRPTRPSATKGIVESRIRRRSCTGCPAATG